MRPIRPRRTLEMMDGEFDSEQAELQEAAKAVRGLLDIDSRLSEIGAVVTTGSVALNVMVARDIDLTVLVENLQPERLAAVAALGAELIRLPSVKQISLRDDTGSWNTDPGYPDGIYLGIICRDEAGAQWSFDVWFVDEPDRQPDLRHLSDFAGKITPDVQAKILAVKRATGGLRSDGRRLPSYEIYTAVVYEGQSPEGFLRLV